MSTRSSSAVRARVQRFVCAALFLALGMLLPFLTGQIPKLGAMLCPMHIPVLLCGFVCGAPWGAAVGAVLPLLRSVTLGSPPMLPIAAAMTVELAVYGAAAGLLYRALPPKISYIYASLAGAMLLGRAAWGAASAAIYALMGNAFSWKLFAAGAFVNALPGIVLQLVLIPLLMIALRAARLIPIGGGRAVRP